MNAASINVNKKIVEIIEALLDAAKTSPLDIKLLAGKYLDFIEARANNGNAALFHFGLSPDTNLIKAFAGIMNENIWEDVVCKQAEKYLDEFDKKIGHTDLKKKIESAIRLLKDLYESPSKELKPETLTLYAKAYLLRSRIFRPKGATVPAKKREAIEKGIKLAEEAIEKDSSNVEAWRIKATLFIEKDRLRGENEAQDAEIVEVLRGALLNGCNKFDESVDDVRIGVLYSELSGKTGYAEKITKIRRIKRSNRRDAYKMMHILRLERAKAYKVLDEGKYHNLIKVEMKKLIIKLPDIRFSYPLWDDTVRFLEELYECKMFCWKELSFEAWTACQSAEGRIKYPLHVRWYWSRMRTLYDLAFLAADSLPLKAVIADSLKSRPALQWSAWDALSRDDKENAECLKAILEAEAQGQTGFIKGFEELKEKCRKTGDDKEPMAITAIPDNWTVIHFYLNKLEEIGYAIIATGNDPTLWKIETFEYKEMFDAYMTWQTNYKLYEERKERAANYLVKLCKKIGEKMAFLFGDVFIPVDNSVLFIPHDFLHRLPLHGAIKDGKVFLQEHPNCYLPAWSYARKKSENTSKGRYLIVNSKDFIENQNYNPSLYEKCFHDFSSLAGLSETPELLAVICHGRADTVNPFKARLLLESGAWTYLDIHNIDKRLENTQVILGACETDLTPPLMDVLDEHLSNFNCLYK